MFEIASSLSYAEFDDIKDYKNAKEMWDKLRDIYRGYDNVLRTKSERLQGKFNEMRMSKGENIVQYCARIKEVVNAIRGANKKIEDETIIRKVLRTLLLIYAIRVYVIQELRCTLGNTLTLEGVIGRLTTFEMSNFDNYTPTTIEYSFKSQLVHKKKGNGKYVKSDSDTYDDELDKLEVLMARRLGRRGK